MSALAGEVTYTFDTDPTSILDIVTSVNEQPWQASGGNPGGFLAVSYPMDSQYGAFAFPDIDDGKIVTAFEFSADLRVGNPQGDRGADGFSISFARSNDPLVAEGGLSSTANFAGGIPEGGSTTGIAISFDTWSGNTLPDGADIEGIIVRVDNKTVLRQSLPTRNGACDDPTSLQTGPRDPAFWATADPASDVYLPASWATLCWQKVIVTLTPDAKLTVSWKGQKILDNFQTAFFPSAGQIILAGRTGGENEHTHFDNITLKTTATAADTQPPTAPTGLTVASAGARRVLLTWGAATDNSGRVAYKVVRDGVQQGGLLTDLQYDDRNVAPSKSYAYEIVAVDVSGNESPKATANATTVAEVDGPGFLVGEIYDNIGGTSIQVLLDDPDFPNAPDRGRYLNGLSFGRGGASGPEFGDNYGIRITGVLIPPVTGQYHFFLRSDDASAFYLNTSGAAIPDPLAVPPIAEETDCCDAFVEPGTLNDDQSTSPTTVDPIQLTAGQRYGFVYLVKEGGGGDNGEVAWRLVGDTTPAANLGPIRGAVLQGKGDPVGAVVNITQQPANATATAYKTATFTVAADVSSPYIAADAAFYQWYRNDTIIPGATAATYTIPVVQPGDNGAKYKAMVGVPGKTATSAEATLTVTPNLPPAVVSVEGSDAFTTATVKFDQPVTAPSATTAGNYTLDKGVTVSAAALVDQFTVRLTTSRQAENTAYTLTINNVQNLGGTAVVPNTTVRLNSWALVPRRARAEVFTGIGGTAVQGLLDDPKYPNSPDQIRYVAGLTFGEPSFGDTWGDNFGTAIKAVVKPTQSGQYRFFVRSDDASQLFINPSGADIPAATGTPVAFENGCCAAFQEPPNERTSEPITLTAGQSYGVLFLVKEGGGGDWGQVGWRREGDTTAAGSLPAIQDAAYWYGPPATEVGPLAISLSGGNVSITYQGTLQSAPAITGPWTDVAGAASPYSTAASAAQLYFRSRQ